MVFFRYIILYAIFLVCSCLYGQQLVQYTQFGINPFLINPGVAGTEEFTHIQANARSQWTGFDGAPVSGAVTMHTPLTKKVVDEAVKNSHLFSDSWFSIGGIINYDKIGPFKQIGIYITPTYNFPVSKHTYS